MATVMGATRRTHGQGKSPIDAWSTRGAAPDFPPTVALSAPRPPSTLLRVPSIFLLACCATVLPPAGAAGAAEHRVNCGGDAFTDDQGRAWTSDAMYNTGKTGDVNVAYALRGELTGAESMYRTMRYDPRRRLPDLIYELLRAQDGAPRRLTLYFLDAWSVTDGVVERPIRAGERRFNVFVDDEIVATNYDIVASCGWFTPCSFSVDLPGSAKGTLSLRFEKPEGIVLDPMVSGIEVVWLGPGVTARPPPRTAPGMRSPAAASTSEARGTTTTTTTTAMTTTTNEPLATTTNEPLGTTPTTTITTEQPLMCDTSAMMSTDDGQLRCFCPPQTACAGEACEGALGFSFWSLEDCPDCQCNAIAPNYNPQACHDIAIDGQSWHDADGALFTCAWYATNPRQCDAGSARSWMGHTARSACCGCGGGAVNLEGASCHDMAVSVGNSGGVWHDHDGPVYNCSWYSQTAGACHTFGRNYRREGTADAATVCCGCGGGSTAPVPSDLPHHTPYRGCALEMGHAYTPTGVDDGLIILGVPAFDPSFCGTLCLEHPGCSAFTFFEHSCSLFEGTHHPPTRRRPAAVSGICGVDPNHLQPTSPPSISPSPPTGQSSLCDHILCAADCLSICGWSTNRGRCIEGGRTSSTELRNSLCREPDDGTTTTTTGTNTAAQMCSASECHGYAPNKPCQCDSSCLFMGDCCNNAAVCGIDVDQPDGQGTPTVSTSTSTPAPEDAVYLEPCGTSSENCSSLGWATEARSGVCQSTRYHNTCIGGRQMDHFAAETVCLAIGARLCTEQDVVEHALSLARDSCGQPADELVWTSESCGDDRYAIVSREGGLNCLSGEQSAAVRCCADAEVASECAITTTTTTTSSSTTSTVSSTTFTVFTTTTSTETSSSSTTSTATSTTTTSTVTTTVPLCNMCTQRPGWYSFGSDADACCYKQSTVKRSWHNALEECRKMGGLLAVISDDTANSHVGMARSFTNKDSWIGGQLAQKFRWKNGEIDEPGRIKWNVINAAGEVSMEEVSDYYNWYRNEGKGKYRGVDEDCIAFGTNSDNRQAEQGNTRWNDAPCDDRKKYVCEFCPVRDSQVLCPSDSPTTSPSAAPTEMTTTTAEPTTTIEPTTTTSNLATTTTTAVTTSTTEVPFTTTTALDTTTTTEEPATSPPMCDDTACGRFMLGRECQCDPTCEQHGDCCDNYENLCASLFRTTTTTDPPTTTDDGVGIATCDTSSQLCSELGWLEIAGSEHCSSNWIGAICFASRPVPHATAEQICLSMGARLCSSDELDGDLGSCGGAEGFPTWTKSKCGRYNHRFLSRSAAGVTCETDDTRLALAKCCADSVINPDCIPTTTTTITSSTTTFTSTTVTEAKYCNACDQLPGWRSYRGSGCCYKQSDHRRNWATALGECREVGGYLATISSRNENDFIAVSRNRTTKDSWIGGQLMQPWQWERGSITSTGRIAWLDGSVADYQNLYEGEGGGVFMGDEENCIAFGTSNNKLRADSPQGDRGWNDASCQHRKKFICEFCPARDSPPLCGSPTSAPSDSPATPAPTMSPSSSPTIYTTTTTLVTTTTTDMTTTTTSPKPTTTTTVITTTSAEPMSTTSAEPTTPDPNTCAEHSCGSYVVGKLCQCDPLCAITNDCCDNFQICASFGPVVPDLQMMSSTTTTSSAELITDSTSSTTSTSTSTSTSTEQSITDIADIETTTRRAQAAACDTITCAARCTGQCGWSSKHNVCKLGGRTTSSEVHIGCIAGVDYGALFGG